ncbi:hypothetical protein [Candidatus Palauibacter sp.]|uniref:hypothetical protein n=1 Tax=Candidatus Palauibacter sp. TaxID=3101350 RepID=UPI003AF2C20C
MFPFRWLLTDELWEIPRFSELSTNASGDLWRAVDEILREHFPESLHREIREAADIPGDGPAWDAEVPSAEPAVRERESGPPTFYSSLTRRRRRDPWFRHKVLGLRSRHPARRATARRGSCTHPVAFA